MARTLHKLKAKQVEALGAGRHSDGGGLYLDRDEQGRSRWLFLWKRDGRRREMGLGSAAKGGVSLADARGKADKAREVVKAGDDPISVRSAVPVEPVPAEPVPLQTFGKIADEYVTSLSPQWRNEKHRNQWRMTLNVYAEPLRSLPVDQITTADVKAVLDRIWLKRPETAARLRGRIERVLDAAKAAGHRQGENPARWRGHLDHLLPKRQKLQRGHHKALPFDEVSKFVAALRQREAIAALALEFLILTAARSGEVLGATWQEIDLTAAVWTLPAERMKAGEQHRVPLVPRAVEILRFIRLLHGSDVGNVAIAKLPIFPGQRGGPLSSMALAMLLRRMEVDATIHGFRSSFRDWAGEVSPFPSDLAEMALAHLVGDATERAYRRGDGFAKRRDLMEAWAAFIAPNVEAEDAAKV